MLRNSEEGLHERQHDGNESQQVEAQLHKDELLVQKFGEMRILELPLLVRNLRSVVNHILHFFQRIATDLSRVGFVLLTVLILLLEPAGIDLLPVL